MKAQFKRSILLIVFSMLFVLTANAQNAKVSWKLDRIEGDIPGWNLVFTFSGLPAGATDNYMQIKVWRERDIFHRANQDPNGSVTKKVKWETLEQMWFGVDDNPKNLGFATNDPDDRDCKVEVEWSGRTPYTFFLPDQLFDNMPVPENTEDIAELPVYYYISYEIMMSNGFMFSNEEGPVPTILTYMYSFDGEIGEGDEEAEPCPPHDMEHVKYVDNIETKSRKVGGGHTYPKQLTYYFTEEFGHVLRHAGEDLYISSQPVSSNQISAFMKLSVDLSLVKDSPFIFDDFNNAQALVMNMSTRDLEENKNKDCVVAIACVDELIKAGICEKKDFPNIVELEKEAQTDEQKKQELEEALEKETLTPDGHLYLVTYDGGYDVAPKIMPRYIVTVAYMDRCKKCGHEENKHKWCFLLRGEKGKDRFVKWINRNNDPK